MFPLRRPRAGSAANGPEGSLLTPVRHEMDDLFDRFLAPQGTWPDWLTGFSTGGPRMDLAESEDDVTVRMELPGVNPEDVEISVSGNVLSVRGEKQQDREEKRRDCLYAERAFGSFARSVTLPSSVDPDKVDATYKDGVLTVKLAKRADAKPKRIPVRTG